MAFSPEQQVHTLDEDIMIVLGYLRQINNDKGSTSANYFNSDYVDPFVLTVCVSFYGAVNFNSRILPSLRNSDKHHFFQLVRDRIKGQFQTELLYRNSRDGSSTDAFHEHCDWQGPTITIIQSTYGHIFGAYTALDLESSGGWKDDEAAFLFLLESNFVDGDGQEVKPRIIDLKQNGKYAVCHNALVYGPMFAIGAIAITDGEAYSFINELVVDGIHGNELCGGDYWSKEDGVEHAFQVKEYEVFAVDII